MDISMQFAIPFLFVLAVVFGVLELTKVFKSRAVHAVVAIAIAFFATSYAPFLTALWSYLPSITWFFIVMFFFAFILQLLGLRGKAVGMPGKETESLVVGGVVLLVLLSAGYMILQEFPIELPLIGGGDNLILLIGLIFIISIFWAAMKIGPEKIPVKKEG